MQKLAMGISSAVLLLCGCAAYQGEPASTASATGLTGSNWSLVSFQSMDDAQGTTTPAEGKSYTLAFGTDGRVAMQLDCNRGTANFSEANASSTGGSLSFGPIASTRAFCPPPDMGELLVAQLPNVASYTLRDGHLFLALKMDGGIFEFAPR